MSVCRAYKMAETTKKVVLFFGKDEIYSHFYPCTFKVDDHTYSCGEQYMMHQKAVLFKDTEMAEKIMNETKPGSMKSHGRKVKNFIDEDWVAKCRDIVFKGNLAKFGQNDELKEILLKTGDLPIAEASPRDRRWGIGLGKNNPKALDKKQWRGKNWLGEALMLVRKNLKEEELEE